MQHAQAEVHRVRAIPTLTQFQGRTWLRVAEPDQGQQDETGGHQQGQQVEQQQEAKESEV